MSFRTAPRSEMVQRVDRVTSNGETVMELEVDVDRKRGDGMTRGPDYAHGPTLLSRTFISDRPSGCCQQGHCICDLTATGGDRKARNGLDDDVQPNALDTHVSRLRRRLTEADAGVTINGVRGLGYVLRETP